MSASSLNGVPNPCVNMGDNYEMSASSLNGVLYLLCKCERPVIVHWDDYDKMKG